MTWGREDLNNILCESLWGVDKLLCGIGGLAVVVLQVLPAFRAALFWSCAVCFVDVVWVL